MLSIMALLFSWEEAIKAMHNKLPKTLMHMVGSMLAEMGGLGFIGLFLGVLVTDGPLGGLAGQISERCLGEKETLLKACQCQK